VSLQKVHSFGTLSDFAPCVSPLTCISLVVPWILCLPSSLIDSNTAACQSLVVQLSLSPPEVDLSYVMAACALGMLWHAVTADSWSLGDAFGDVVVESRLSR